LLALLLGEFCELGPLFGRELQSLAKLKCFFQAIDRASGIRANTIWQPGTIDAAIP
jgi:hypothetical protein